MTFIVGILNLQGGSYEINYLLSFYQNIETKYINNKKELLEIDALIIPGGESTTIGKCIEYANMKDDLINFSKNKPIFGICAGLILLSKKINNYDKSEIGSLDLLDIEIEKNYYGSQKNSFLGEFIIENEYINYGLSNKCYFIRAPIIKKIGKDINVLAKDKHNNKLAVKKNNCLVTCFHPEISSKGNTWFSYFLKEICNIEININIFPENIFYSNIINDDNVKKAFPIFQKRGVIMDVINDKQAVIAQEAGAVSVMALEKIPADIKKDGGIARSTDPKLIKEIINSVTIPVMAKARIGHFAEAQILEALEVDCIDESEVLTCADELYHINKNKFSVPFVCGAKDLGEALRRISEGASMIRLKGNAGTGNVMHAVKHARAVFSEIRNLQSLLDEEIYLYAKKHQVCIELVKQVRKIGRLPVVTFAAGGIATPADVSLMMQLGCDGVFVGSGIFKGENPLKRAKAMVQACSNYDNFNLLANVSENLGKPMVGILEKNESYTYIQNVDENI